MLSAKHYCEFFSVKVLFYPFLNCFSHFLRRRFFFYSFISEYSFLADNRISLYIIQFHVLRRLYNCIWPLVSALNPCARAIVWNRNYCDFGIFITAILLRQPAEVFFDA